MCGILAIYCKNEEENIGKIVEGYNMLSNRGPDKGQIIIRDHILCFRRLAVVDKTDKGMQPFSVDGVHLLCNGEIYNHQELEEKYQITCNSSCDCECILHLYKKEGIQMTIEALSGDFAFVIIDGDMMYFARDRIGVRPLFYGITKSGNMAVASYARAITSYCDHVEQLPPGWIAYDSTTESLVFSFI